MIDLAIVGAGAAGISAAGEARERGLTCIVLEASDRVGGRTYTVDWHGRALDLGGTWLHSASRNPLGQLAQELGFDIDRSPVPWRNQYRELGYTKEEQAASWAATEAFTDRLRDHTPPTDRASDALEPGCAWNGFLEALNGYLNGTSLKNTSAVDFMAYWDSSENSNWRLPKGYGALLMALARDLDVRTGCIVQQVEWSMPGVRLASDKGTVEARHAIIAIPTNVLASGAITFLPQLDDRLHAAAQLPLGRVEKLFLALNDPESAPKDAHLIGNPHSGDTGSYMLRPMGMPLIEGFFGGDWLEGLNENDLAAKTREELGNLLDSDFVAGLSPVAYSDWKSHAFICGSYSFARPGRHSARAVLRAPVDGPIAFAGEACSDSDYATVHGAWESGRQAVAQLFGEVA